MNQTLSDLSEATILHRCRCYPVLLVALECLVIISSGQQDLRHQKYDSVNRYVKEAIDRANSHPL